MAEDLAQIGGEELERRIAEAQSRLRPIEQELARMRSERDVLLTERRRRERGAHRQARADVKAAMKEGRVPTVAELVGGADPAALDAYVYNLKTGGEVGLGYPGARRPSIALTDGAQTAQAYDFDEAARLFASGWELGSPGRPGVRVHFPGTRQERLVSAEEVFARLRS